MFNTQESIIDETGRYSPDEIDQMAAIGIKVERPISESEPETIEPYDKGAERRAAILAVVQNKAYKLMEGSNYVFTYADGRPYNGEIVFDDGPRPEDPKAINEVSRYGYPVRKEYYGDEYVGFAFHTAPKPQALTPEDVAE